MSLGGASSTKRPAGNGLGGEGSAASISSSIGRVSPSSGYLGNGLGGDGSVAMLDDSTSLCGGKGSLSSTGGAASFMSTG